MGVSARATVETLALMAGVFLVQLLLMPLFVAIGIPVFHIPGSIAKLLLAPWTWVVSVYAHGGPMHLVGNALILVPFGLAVEQVTSRFRFHAFFVTVGAVAGLSQVLFTKIVPLMPARGVLGASGAILALVGYAIAGNRVSDQLVGAFELDARAQLAALAAVGAAIALWLAGPGVANIGHFTGLILGLLAGRARLLHVDSSAGV